MTKVYSSKLTFMYRGLRGLFRAMFKLVFPVDISGKENLPENGPAILCSNHISLFDPILLGCMSDPHVTFMAKQELFQVPIIGMIINNLGALPVKRGQVDRKTIKDSLAELTAGNVFGIFPEGTRHSNDPPLRGVSFLAAKSDSSVIPITIKGPYKIFQKNQVIIHPPKKFDKNNYGQDQDALLEFSEEIMEVINKDL